MKELEAFEIGLSVAIVATLHLVIFKMLFFYDQFNFGGCFFRW